MASGHCDHCERMVLSPIAGPSPQSPSNQAAMLKADLQSVRFQRGLLWHRMTVLSSN